MARTLKESFFKKHVALTQEHGSWVFLFSPLIIGLFAGGRWTAGSGYLVLTVLAVFLFKQPLTVAVKVGSGRRGKQDLQSAYFWMGVYGVFALIGFAGMWVQGFAWLAVLALPGLPVLVWYLYLVARRAERRQIGVEIVASGALALGATAAYWIGIGETNPLGWWLWLLTWFQSAASIVYAALRLDQRGWKELPWLGQRVKVAGRALGYTGFNLGWQYSWGSGTPSWRGGVGVCPSVCGNGLGNGSPGDELAPCPDRHSAIDRFHPIYPFVYHFLVGGLIKRSDRIEEADDFG
ncbi:MAG: YwiC-like family protein [Anaerolineae bacterium]|nr:YwiC-like family protein [Anaerolineae bacterium]